MIADNIKKALPRHSVHAGTGQTFVLLAADLATSEDTYLRFFIAHVRFIHDELIPDGQGYSHVAVVSSPDQCEVHYRPTRDVGIYESQSGRRIALHERIAL